MEKYFSTYIVAKTLKDLGFNDGCLAMYLNENKLDIGRDWNVYKCSESKFLYLSAPLWDQTLEYLRNKYNVYIEPEMWLGNKNKPMFSANGYYIKNDEREYIDESEICDSYDDYYIAIEKTILKVKKLIDEKTIFKNKN